MTKPITNAAVFSAPVIARLLNISERHLRRLAADGVIPKTGRGEYPLAGCIQGYVAFLQNSAGIDFTDPSEMGPFMRRAFYQAELDKLKIQALCAELIPCDDYDREMWKLVALTEECLNGLLERLVRECGLTGPSLAVAEKRVDRVRKYLRGRISEPGRDNGD